MDISKLESRPAASQKRNIKLMHRLRPRRRQAPKASSMERIPEAQNGQLRETRCLIIHARADLLRSPLDTVAAGITLVQHEGGFVGDLIGFRARLRGEEGVHPLSGLRS